ncbi:hypothetical protein, partial [Aeromonas caviae]|uniref:hypothetical protein n=1 Tax=Aeromonas caviae TaxID=648 RepID=UPI0019650EF0
RVMTYFKVSLSTCNWDSAFLFGTAPFLFGTAIFVYGLFHWRNHITHSVSLMQKSPAQATPTVSQRCEKTA